MQRGLSFIRTALAAACAMVAVAANATIVVYTSEASFMAAVGSSGVDSFNDLVRGDVLAGSLARDAGSFGYTIGSSGTFFVAGSGADPWLATDLPAETITISGFTAEAYAIGANLFGTDVFGHALQRTGVIVTATDANGSVTRTLTRTTPGSFIGFVSDTPLSSLTISAVESGLRAVWPTVNDLIIATPVPEPETYALFLAGVAVVGFVAARRGKR